jgi:hypothetical protein
MQIGEFLSIMAWLYARRTLRPKPVRIALVSLATAHYAEGCATRRSCFASARVIDVDSAAQRMFACATPDQSITDHINTIIQKSNWRLI